MYKVVNLTEGSISKSLIMLSLPIMGTSFIQMAYNLIDMMWVGKIGSEAVAAVGTAGFFPMLAMSFIMISRVGAEIKVAQSMGKGDIDEARLYVKSSIEINLLFAIMYSIFLIIFNKQLISLFELGDMGVINMSRNYLYIVTFGMFFHFINPVFTAIFNGVGNSSLPFKINTIGLIANIILDPILIFGIGDIKGLGVSGAALATITAQMIVTISFLVIIFKNKQEYFKVKVFKDINIDSYKVLYKLGIPVAVQNGMFTIFSMMIGVVVASFGPVAVAAQKVGVQIEAISWMTADGFAVAISSFNAQNYGAKKYERIEKGVSITIMFGTILGLVTMFILYVFGESIFKLFINETDAIINGTSYLQIIAYSQVFMCVEILLAGSYKGLSKTFIPSFIGIVFTAIRIPMAYFLSSKIGLDGVWWSLTISSVLKGIFMTGSFMYLKQTKRLYNSNQEDSINCNDLETI